MIGHRLESVIGLKHITHLLEMSDVDDLQIDSLFSTIFYIFGKKKETNLKPKLA